MLKAIFISTLMVWVYFVYSGISFAGGGKITNSIGMEFVYINAGSFWMGSTEKEPGRGTDETRHHVTLTRGFYIQTTEVTQGQWTAVMGSNPSYFNNCGENCPVENVSWVDAQEFIRQLNQMEKINTYRLPTEAEWEFACRSGSTTRFAFGARLHRNHANYDDSYFLFGILLKNFQGKTIPVGSLSANQWRLYDMHGNVWEWCQDRHGTYPLESVTDPIGPSHGRNRVNRGGSWVSSPEECRSARRFGNGADYRNDLIGFRIVKMP